VPGQHEWRVTDGQPRSEPGSPCNGSVFVGTYLSGVDRARVGIMNGAVRSRRLASPVRLVLGTQLGGPLDGAWWPHTASIARELPELIGAISPRLGEILAISINWSSLEGSPDLDALNHTRTIYPDKVVGRQRLMMVTGSRASANLLVVPCRTSSALAITVMRQAAALPVPPLEMNTLEFRTADEIVHAARAESTLCARRLGVSELTAVGDADSPMTI
jgi:Family of unknown function (DUF5994)